MELELKVDAKKCVLCYDKSFDVLRNDLGHPFQISFSKQFFGLFVYYIGLSLFDLGIVDRVKTILEKSGCKRYFNEESVVFDYSKNAFIPVASFCERLHDQQVQSLESFEFYKPCYVERLIEELCTVSNSTGTKLFYIGKIDCIEPVDMFIIKPPKSSGHLLSSLLICQTETKECKQNVVDISPEQLCCLINELTKYREINIVLFLLYYHNQKTDKLIL